MVFSTLTARDRSPILQIRDRTGRVVNEVYFNDFRHGQFIRRRPLSANLYEFYERQRRILKASLDGLEYAQSIGILGYGQRNREMNSWPLGWSGRKRVYDEPENYIDAGFSYEKQKSMHHFLLRGLTYVLD